MAGAWPLWPLTTAETLVTTRARSCRCHGPWSQPPIIYIYYSINLSTKEKNISHKCKGRQPPTKVYKNINQQSYQNCQLRSQEPASSRSLSSLYCIIICNCMIVWCWAQKSDEKYLHLKFPSKVQPQVTSNIHKCNHF